MSQSLTSTAGAASAAISIPQRAVAAALILVFLSSLLNYMDRYLLAAVLDEVKRDLQLSDTQLGLLGGLAFSLFYAVAAVPMGRIVDRAPLRKVMTVCMVGWSLMSVACGLTHSFWQLFIARVGVAIGEAGGIPSSNALLAGIVRLERRALAFSTINVGASLGVFVGFALGGWIASVYGWRAAFLWLGPLGIVLAMLIWRWLPEPPRRVAPPSDAHAGHAWQTLRTLWSIRTYRWLLVSIGFSTFVNYGVTTWLSPFYIRVHGVSVAEAGSLVGISSGLSVAAGALLGGLIADRLVVRDRRWLIWIMLISAVLALPFYALIVLAPSAQIAAMAAFAAASINALSLAPLQATSQSVVPASMRGTATAFLMLGATLIGTGLGPLAIGVASDLLHPLLNQESLRAAIGAALLVQFVPIIAYYRAARSVVKDLAAVE